jgi:hypothetical protein
MRYGEMVYKKAEDLTPCPIVLVESENIFIIFACQLPENKTISENNVGSMPILLVDICPP